MQPKKKKVDKRDLAENNIFFCDRCDRGFKDEERFNDHAAQHQKVSNYANVSSSISGYS